MVTSRPPPVFEMPRKSTTLPRKTPKADGAGGEGGEGGELEGSGVVVAAAGGAGGGGGGGAGPLVVQHSTSGPQASLDDLLRNHLESLRRKRGAFAWAFFPDANAHVIEGETGVNAGSRYVVCAACHPTGLPLTAAASLCGGKQTGVFRCVRVFILATILSS